jgi:hypothetical protein
VRDPTEAEKNGLIWLRHPQASATAHHPVPNIAQRRSAFMARGMGTVQYDSVPEAVDLVISPAGLEAQETSARIARIRGRGLVHPLNL